MKFFVSSDLKRERPIKWMISGLILFLSLFTLSNAAVKASIFGTTPEQIAQTLQGDPDEFIEPFALGSLLELIHVDLFFMSLLFLLLSALQFRLIPAKAQALFWSTLLLFCIILSFVAPFLAFYDLLYGAHIWLISFVTLHALLGLTYIQILYFLWRPHA